MDSSRNGGCCLPVEKKKKRNRECVRCRAAGNILLEHTPFCSACFTVRFEREFSSALRRSLSHTERKRVRKVLVVADESVGGRVLTRTVSKNRSSMVDYTFYTEREAGSADEMDAAGRMGEAGEMCGNGGAGTISEDAGHASSNSSQQQASKHANSHLDRRNSSDNGEKDRDFNREIARIREISRYAEENGYDCVVMREYAAEVAEMVLKLIRTGQIDSYKEMFFGKAVPLCYPFYSVPHKSVLYYALKEGLIESPQYKREETNRLREADRTLIRKLMKESPSSISNLVKVQQRISEVEQVEGESG